MHCKVTKSSTSWVVAPAFAYFFLTVSQNNFWNKILFISFCFSFSPLPFPGKILLRILADTVQFKVHLSLAMKFSVRCQYFRKTRINHISKCLIMSSPQTPFQGGGCIYRKKIDNPQCRSCFFILSKTFTIWNGNSSICLRIKNPAYRFKPYFSSQLKLRMKIHMRLLLNQLSSHQLTQFSWRLIPKSLVKNNY